MEVEFDPDKEALNRARHKLGFGVPDRSSTASISTMRTTGRTMAKPGS